MVHVPPIDAVGFGQELVMIPSIEDACPTKDGTSASTPSGNASKRNALDSLSSWEDNGAFEEGSLLYYT